MYPSNPGITCVDGGTIAEGPDLASPASGAGVAAGLVAQAMTALATMLNASFWQIGSLDSVANERTLFRMFSSSGLFLLERKTASSLAVMMDAMKLR